MAMNILHHFILMNQLKQDILNAAAWGTDETPPDDWDDFAEWLENVQSQTGNSPRPNIPRRPIRPPTGNIANGMDAMWQWAQDWQRQMDAIQEALRIRGVPVPQQEPWDRLPDRIITIPPIQHWNRRPRDEVTIPPPFITEFQESLVIEPFDMVDDHWTEWVQIPKNIIPRGTDTLVITRHMAPGEIHGELIIQYGENPPQVYRHGPHHFNVPKLGAIDLLDHDYPEVGDIEPEDIVWLKPEGFFTFDEDCIVWFPSPHDIIAEDTVRILAARFFTFNEDCIIIYPGEHRIVASDKVELSTILPLITAEDTFDPPPPLDSLDYVWRESVATSLRVEIPVKAGGTAVAIVTTRGTASFTPSDWQLVAVSNPGISDNHHNIWAFIRPIPDNATGIIDIIVSQDSGGQTSRIYVQLFMFSNRITLSELWQRNADNQAVGNTVAFPNAPDKMPMDSIMWSMSNMGGEPYWITNPNDIMRFSSDTGYGRQVSFIDWGMGPISREFIATPDITGGITALMLRINEPSGLLYWHKWSESENSTTHVDQIIAQQGADVVAIVTVGSSVIFPDEWYVIARLALEPGSPDGQIMYALQTTARSSLVELAIQQLHPTQIYMQLISLTQNVELNNIWSGVNSNTMPPKPEEGSMVLYAMSARERGEWQTTPDDILRLRAMVDDPENARQEIFFDHDGMGSVNRIISNSSIPRGIIMLGVNGVRPFPRRYPSVPLTDNTSPQPYVAIDNTSSLDAYKVFDYDENSLWESGDNTFIDQVNLEGFWVQVDLGIPRLITRYVIRGIHPSTPLGFPRDFVLFGSHDGVEWTEIDSQTDFTTNYDWYFEKQFEEVVMYRFYKLHITRIQSGTSLLVSEFELWRDRTSHRLLPIHPTMTSNELPTEYIVTASSEWDSDQEPWRAFDETPNRWWTTAETSPNNGWIQLDMGDLQDILGYAIISRSQLAPVGPRDFQLLGSNDGDNWDIIDEQFGVEWVAPVQRQSFEFLKLQSYRMYRLNVAAISQPHLHLSIGEIEFLNMVRPPLPLEIMGTSFNEGTVNTITTNIECIIGTSILAIVSTRSDFVVSSGWERIAFMECNPLEDAINGSDRITVFRRIARSTIESITINSTVTRIMGVRLINFSRVVDVESAHEVIVSGDTTILTPQQKRLRQQALYVCINRGFVPDLWSTTPDNEESVIPRVGESVGDTLGSVLATWFDDGSNRVINRSFITSVAPVSEAGVLALYFADEVDDNLELIPNQIRITNTNLSQTVIVGGTAQGDIIIEP